MFFMEGVYMEDKCSYYGVKWIKDNEKRRKTYQYAVSDFNELVG